jgi:2-dehydro-3-deoxyphosphogluconate aldolase/(4S)-4-hydroxy-2-oxoglutarate aldolase
VTKQEVRDRIVEVGVIPAVRVDSIEDAMFAAEAVSRGGVPIVEVRLTVPNAQKLIAHLVRNAPEVMVGAGSISDVETARRCLDAGAQFLTSDGLDVGTVEFAVQNNIVIFPGVLTPTDIITAWKLGPDYLKVVPCGQVGGAGYIRALKAMFSKIPLIAAGGVNQQTASGYILAGAVALGIGSELISREAIQMRQQDRIAELARRFTGFVSSARS